MDVLIDYTNYKGERALRHIIPISLYYGTTEKHPHPGWFVQAYAMDRDGAVRDFAADDIHSWRAYPDAATSAPESSPPAAPAARDDASAQHGKEQRP